MLFSIYPLEMYVSALQMIAARTQVKKKESDTNYCKGTIFRGDFSFIAFI